MITIEDKLDIFYKLVFSQEEEECKNKLKDQEEKNKSILQEKKLEYERNKEELINRKNMLAETQKNQMLSKATQSNREKILLKREEILKDLVKSLEHKANDFVLSKDYKTYILNNVAEVIKDVVEEKIIISLTERDKEKLQDSILQLGIKNKKNIIFDTLKLDKIGGFLLCDKEKTYSLDNSFKTIIEENRYKIGKRLYTVLEKTGGLNG